MHRVVKKGGFVQLMIPFMFPYHSYPTDFQRYTLSGVGNIMKEFEKIELSILTGPTSALNVFIREYLRLLFPLGNKKFFRQVMNGISGWLTFPLKYLDIWLNNKPEAHWLAAAFFYVGKKN